MNAFREAQATRLCSPLPRGEGLGVRAASNSENSIDDHTERTSSAALTLALSPRERGLKFSNPTFFRAHP
jgi:hypothetical protein